MSAPRGVPRRVARIVGRPVFIGVAAVVALALGYAGYRGLPHAHVSVSDALYRSLQLFALDSSAEGSIPWQLDVARFLAPAVLGYAAIATVVVLAREHAQRAWARLFAVDHLVVVGLGARGSALARRAERQLKTVAIERESSNGSITGLRSRGVPVVVGDGRDPEILDLARVSRAGDVVVLTGDDSVNLEIFAACQQAVRSAPRMGLHVAIDDPALWAQLHRVVLGRASSAGRIEFLNVADRVARELVRVGGRAGQSWQRLAVAGAGAVVDRVVVNALRSGAVAGRDPAVVLYGQAKGRLAGLERQEPWIREVVRLEGEELAAAELDTRVQAGRAEPATLGVVCGVSAAEGLSLAASLASALPRESTVVVAVRDGEIGESLEQTPFDFSRIELVSAEEKVLSPWLLSESGTELIARGTHEQYVRDLEAQGETSATNPSLVPWDELQESLKESNRKFADSVATKLDELGAVLVPLAGADPAPLDLPKVRLEEMARREHERWINDLRADGWRHTTGEKDPASKLHPLLVPWEELREPERQKDRDAIRGLPQQLARVGYALRLPDR